MIYIAIIAGQLIFITIIWIVKAISVVAATAAAAGGVGGILAACRWIPIAPIVF